MKTCLFSPCYLDGNDGQGSSRLERNMKYLDYYSQLKDFLSVDSIYFFDNASTPENLSRLLNHGIPVSVFRFPEHLPFGGGLQYPYWWRSIYAASTLIAMGYEKIIHIDTDGFIHSPRLLRYLRSLDSGWTTFFSQKYGFPTSEFFVLCKDAFPAFHKFTETPWQERVGQLAEVTLPFTLVNRDFKVDRYGEAREPWTAEIDFYGQCPVDLPIGGLKE